METMIRYPLSSLQILRVYDLLASSHTLGNEVGTRAEIVLKPRYPNVSIVIENTRWSETYLLPLAN